MHSVLFLGEGPSDRGIVTHLSRLAEDGGVEIMVTAPDTDLLPSPDRSVAGKLNSLRTIGATYDLIVIHRDADNAGVDARRREILSAAGAVMPASVCVPAIPVRMTEAWLVLDEQQIRNVAGNPNGRTPLAVPTWREAERLSDPKRLLRELLLDASGLSGRRRNSFASRLSHHRSQMLETLDPAGPVHRLSSWQQFEQAVRQGLASLGPPAG